MTAARTEITIRPLEAWPPGWRDRKERRPNPFRGTYTSTLQLLDYELDQLAARAAHIQLDVTHGDVRRDGHLRANARVGHPGVILTVDSRRHGTLVYPCDTFAGRWSSDPPDWQINLRAIALGLEALRKVERYGIAGRGQQYAGFAALPPAREVGPAAMTVDDAVRFLCEQSGWIGDFDPLADPEQLPVAYKTAARRLHPDAGGDPALFLQLKQARDLIERHR